MFLRNVAGRATRAMLISPILVGFRAKNSPFVPKRTTHGTEKACQRDTCKVALGRHL